MHSVSALEVVMMHQPLCWVVKVTLSYSPLAALEATLKCSHNHNSSQICFCCFRMGIFSLLRIIAHGSRTNRKLTVGLLRFPSTKINLTTSRAHFHSHTHTHTPSKYRQPNLGPRANKEPYHGATPIPIFLNCLVF